MANPGDPRFVARNLFQDEGTKLSIGDIKSDLWWMEKSRFVVKDNI